MIDETVLLIHMLIIQDLKTVRVAGVHQLFVHTNWKLHFQYFILHFQLFMLT